MNKFGVYREKVLEKFAGVVLHSDLEEITDEEFSQAKELYNKTSECKHDLIKDEPGWLYDYRYCAVCGVGLGTV